MHNYFSKSGNLFAVTYVRKMREHLIVFLRSYVREHVFADRMFAYVRVFASCSYVR